MHGAFLELWVTPILCEAKSYDKGWSKNMGFGVANNIANLTNFCYYARSIKLVL
jgi:hypothetical protein